MACTLRHRKIYRSVADDCDTHLSIINLQLRAPTARADGFHEVSRELAVWTDMTRAHGFIDITYKVAYADMTAKITINRPELHNAFRPITVNEMRKAMDLAQDDR